MCKDHVRARKGTQKRLKEPETGSLINLQGNWYPMAQEVALETKDGWEIHGTYYPASTTRAVVLLPQLNRDRHSYEPLIQRLEGKMHILAIDLRGHGKSANKGTVATFAPGKPFTDMELDVEAAAVYLQEQGVQQLFLIGSSIGANTALNYGSRHKVSGAVLLSPGLDYRGITTETGAKGWKPDSGTRIPGTENRNRKPGTGSGLPTAGDRKPLLVLVGQGDGYSADSARRIAEWSGGELEIYETDQHGTFLLADEAVLKRVEKFLGVG